MLAEHKADLNTPDKDGDAPIFFAVSSGHADVVQLLVPLGAEVNPVPDNWGDTPLNEARSTGHSSIVEILLEAGAE